MLRCSYPRHPTRNINIPKTRIISERNDYVLEGQSFSRVLIGFNWKLISPLLRGTTGRRATSSKVYLVTPKFPGRSSTFEMSNPLQPLFDALLGLQITNYVTGMSSHASLYQQRILILYKPIAAASTILAYDIMLSFSREVEYIWK